jgi:hypothetical protein
MFYISSKKGKKYGVTDTSDGVEEFYRPEELLQIERIGAKIEGIFRENGKIYLVILSENILPLLHSQVGTPVVVKMTATTAPKQTLYVGYTLDKGKERIIFSFFDDSGISGEFGISTDFARNHNDCTLDFNNNDPRRVVRLIQRVKG